MDHSITTKQKAIVSNLIVYLGLSDLRIGAHDQLLNRISSAEIIPMGPITNNDSQWWDSGEFTLYGKRFHFWRGKQYVDQKCQIFISKIPEDGLMLEGLLDLCDSNPIPTIPPTGKYLQDLFIVCFEAPTQSTIRAHQGS